MIKRATVFRLLGANQLQSHVGVSHRKLMERDVNSQGTIMPGIFLTK
jgi:hypothetical protein